MYYVYLLSAPDGSVFYVGKGKNGRFLSHEKAALGAGESHNEDVIRIIQSLQKQGAQICRTIVFASLDEEAVLLEEQVNILRHAETIVNRRNVNRKSGRIKSKYWHICELCGEFTVKPYREDTIEFHRTHIMLCGDCWIKCGSIKRSDLGSKIRQACYDIFDGCEFLQAFSPNHLQRLPEYIIKNYKQPAEASQNR